MDVIINALLFLRDTPLWGRPGTIIFSPGPPSAEIPFPNVDLIPSPIYCIYVEVLYYLFICRRKLILNVAELSVNIIFEIYEYNIYYKPVLHRSPLHERRYVLNVGSSWTVFYKLRRH